MYSTCLQQTCTYWVTRKSSSFLRHLPTYSKGGKSISFFLSEKGPKPKAADNNRQRQSELFTASPLIRQLGKRKKEERPLRLFCVFVRRGRLRFSHNFLRLVRSPFSFFPLVLWLKGKDKGSLPSSYDGVHK